jgi:hypothetical protein
MSLPPATPKIKTVTTTSKPKRIHTGYTVEVIPDRSMPEDDVTVRWTVPVRGGGDQRSDWIGLYRVHQSDPDSCMTSKYLNVHQSGRDVLRDVVVNENGDIGNIEILAGEMRFRAPPAIGRYDFRYFRDGVARRPGAGAKERRQQRKEKERGQRERGMSIDETLPQLPESRSNMLTVEAQGEAFIHALRFLMTKIENDGGNGGRNQRNNPRTKHRNKRRQDNQGNLREYAGAVAQLVRLLEQLRVDWEGRPLTYAKQLWPAISMSVVKNFNHARSKPSSKTERDLASIGRTNRSLVGVATMNPAVRALLNPVQLKHLEVWRERLLATDVCDGVSFVAVDLASRIRVMRRDDRGQMIVAVSKNGNVLADPKKESKEAVYYDVPMFPEGIPEDKILTPLTMAVNEMSPTFMPSGESNLSRLELQKRLDDMLSENLKSLSGVYGVTLAVFGSSANGFGSSTSDLDMCLNFDKNTTVNSGGTALEPSALVLKIAEILEAGGMLSVDTSRVTARIPVIQFVDPVTQLDCDICVNNQLALRNTKLLRSYSLFDERVRLVAYIVKTWSKRRDLNSPERSTLSSYGFLITLFMHLQRRVPVLVCSCFYSFRIMLRSIYFIFTNFSFFFLSLLVNSFRIE